MAGGGGVGALNNRGCPTIGVEVSGAFPATKRSFTAIVDTGFSGFALLPMLQAFPIGLVLHNTVTITLADGNQHSRFVCLGYVTFGGETQLGTVIIEPNADEALLGMEFLKKFKLTLFTDPDIPAVILVPSDALKQALAATQKTTAGSGGTGTP